MSEDSMQVESGADPTLVERFQDWTERNPDTWTGIQAGVGNLNGGTPQSNVMQGAAEAFGAGLGERLYPPRAHPPRR
jgi:hypothetical protein